MTTLTPHAVGTPCWLDLTTPDPEAVRPFYEVVLGWRFQGQSTEKGEFSLIYRERDVVAAAVPPMGEGGAWCLYFASADVYADAGRIRELGGQVTLEPGPVGESGSLLMAKDPTGAAFGLWQAGQHVGMTDGGSGRPGTFAWAEVHTRDAGRARDFYTALLHSTSQPIPEMGYHTLYQGEHQHAGIMQMTQRWPGDAPSQWVVYFSVASADRAVELAQASGGRVLSPPHDSPYGRLATLQDPAGALFSVIQLPA